MLVRERTTSKIIEPDSALYIARESGIMPEEFIYLGDSAIDVKAALGAGIYPIGALWGFRTANVFFIVVIVLVVSNGFVIDNQDP